MPPPRCPPAHRWCGMRGMDFWHERARCPTRGVPDSCASIASPPSFACVAPPLQVRGLEAGRQSGRGRLRGSHASPPGQGGFMRPVQRQRLRARLLGAAGVRQRHGLRGRLPSVPQRSEDEQLLPRPHRRRACPGPLRRCRSAWPLHLAAPLGRSALPFGSATARPEACKARQRPVRGIRGG